VAAEFIRTLKALAPNFDEAVELTYAAARITDDDIRAVTHPNLLQRKHNRAALKKRDWHKWKLLCHMHISDIHPGAFKALNDPITSLRVKAARLKLNGFKPTNRDLAGALGISPATLYRRFGGDAVRSVCHRTPIHSEAPASVRYQLTGLE
jgi:hypothetical protein